MRVFSKIVKLSCAEAFELGLEYGSENNPLLEKLDENDIKKVYHLSIKHLDDNKFRLGILVHPDTEISDDEIKELFNKIFEKYLDETV